MIFDRLLKKSSGKRLISKCKRKFHQKINHLNIKIKVGQSYNIQNIIQIQI